jgi:hypothetical protein
MKIKKLAKRKKRLSTKIKSKGEQADAAKRVSP